MHLFLIGFIQAAVTIGVWELTKRIFQKDARPYKWKCQSPGCIFKVETNDIELLDLFASQHTTHTKGSDQ